MSVVYSVQCIHYSVLSTKLNLRACSYLSQNMHTDTEEASQPKLMNGWHWLLLVLSWLRNAAYQLVVLQQPLQCNSNGYLIEARRTYSRQASLQEQNWPSSLLAYSDDVFGWACHSSHSCRHLMVKAHCLQAVLSCQPWKALAVATM